MIAKTVIGNHMKIEPIRTNLSNDLRRGTNKLVKSDSPSLTSDLFGPFEIERLRGVVHKSKKQRDKFQQRILEAQSHKDIIQALNNIDPRLTKRQRQGQEHMQHQPSAQSPNPSRTSFVMSQSTLPHHPTVPPEPEHKYAWDIEKRGEVEHYQLQQGQQYQQENEKQHDLKRLGQRNQLEQGKRDLQRLGQKDQLEQGKRDLRRLGQKDQLEQRQQDQLNQEQQDLQRLGQKDQQEQRQQDQLNQEQQDLQRLGQKDQLEQGQQDLQRLGQKDQQKKVQKDKQNKGQKDQLNQGQQDQLNQGQQDQLNQGQQDANCKSYGISAIKGRLKTERWTLFLRLMIILMLCGCPVSGMCSTCLVGRCYDNGECIIGCQRGYVGKYCETKCPPGCVNNECYIDRIKGTISCISGCVAGYCGAKCSLRCPEGCLTCDRQCDSCNMTLCPERRFGVGCSEICSLRYEKCDRENGQCIRCRRGYYGDECDKECLTCSTREDDISDKCLSGCEKCQTQETCAAGFYGEKCDHRCSSGCIQFDGDGASRRLCNRATGECSDGCVSGYHGLTCNYTCNKFCVGGVCNQYDGVCTSGCISGYSQWAQDCEEVQDTGKKDVSVSHTLLLLSIISVAVSALVFSLAVLVFARRTIRRSRINFKTENADKNERESLK